MLIKYSIPLLISQESFLIVIIRTMYPCSTNCMPRLLVLEIVYITHFLVLLTPYS